ncbi:hypothetical protein [Natronorubrum sp. A-ect3]|uniref:hypothetical protein n=1 Tax=Natronorubrum sp. A-ect3 TaxID=3242698 RepID=UPI00359E6C77
MSINAGMQTALIDITMRRERQSRDQSGPFSGALECPFSISAHTKRPPYSVDLLDDRIVISGYDADSGAVQVVVVTAMPVTRAWAKSECSSGRDDARPLTAARIVD